MPWVAISLWMERVTYWDTSLSKQEIDMALTPGSVVKISGAPVAGEQLVEELTYTGAQIEEAVRLSLTPGHLAAQLAESASPIDTVVVQDVPVLISGADQLTLTDSQDFDFDVGNERFFYDNSGAVDVPFQINASMSFAMSVAPATLVTLRALKNGVAIEGIYVQRTISGSSSIGVVSISGHFTLSDTDYIEIQVEATNSGTFSAWSFATSIKEEGQ